MTTSNNAQNHNNIDPLNKLGIVLSIYYNHHIAYVIMIIMSCNRKLPHFLLSLCAFFSFHQNQNHPYCIMFTYNNKVTS